LLVLYLIIKVRLGELKGKASNYYQTAPFFLDILLKIPLSLRYHRESNKLLLIIEQKKKEIAKSKT
ncbi:MAG: hypothetical protein ACXV45_05670, partial [Halobacteriota archaeon]